MDGVEVWHACAWREADVDFDPNGYFEHWSNFPTAACSLSSLHLGRGPRYS